MANPLTRPRGVTRKSRSVLVSGSARAPVRLDPSTVAEQGLSTVVRQLSYDCASEGRRTGRWRGIPLLDLLDWAQIDPEATHLLVESEDGHLACIAIERALGGILALERVASNGEFMEQHYEGCPRVLAPGIAAAKTVKGVRRITAFHSKSGTDPCSIID